MQSQPAKWKDLVALALRGTMACSMVCSDPSLGCFFHCPNHWNPILLEAQRGAAYAAAADTCRSCVASSSTSAPGYSG